MCRSHVQGEDKHVHHVNKKKRKIEVLPGSELAIAKTKAVPPEGIRPDQVPVKAQSCLTVASFDRGRKEARDPDASATRLRDYATTYTI